MIGVDCINLSAYDLLNYFDKNAKSIQKSVQPMGNLTNTVS